MNEAVLDDSTPFLQPILDEIFHFAPFLTLDHHMIFLIYYLLGQPHPVPPNHSIHSLSSSDSNHPRIRDDIPQPLAASEDDSEDGAPQQTSIVSHEQSQLPYRN